MDYTGDYQQVIGADGKPTGDRLDRGGHRGQADPPADAIAASEGYALSQRKRKLIEQDFGWAKTVGGIRQVMVRGLKRVDHLFVLTMTAYNLTRMRSLGQIRPQGL